MKKKCPDKLCQPLRQLESEIKRLEEELQASREEGKMLSEALIEKTQVGGWGRKRKVAESRQLPTLGLHTGAFQPCRRSCRCGPRPTN